MLALLAAPAVMAMSTCHGMTPACEATCAVRASLPPIEPAIAAAPRPMGLSQPRTEEAFLSVVLSVPQPPPKAASVAV